jgi:DNA modification methylase
MKIDSLEKMESIVSSNPSLKWEGWNVIFFEKDQDASLKKNAAFIDSTWHKKVVFENTGGVWDIPDSILRKGDVQVR